MWGVDRAWKKREGGNFCASAAGKFSVRMEKGGRGRRPFGTAFFFFLLQSFISRFLKWLVEEEDCMLRRRERWQLIT